MAYEIAPPYGVGLSAASNLAQAAAQWQQVQQNKNLLQQQDAQTAAVKQLPGDIASLAAAPPEVRQVTPGTPAVAPTVTETSTGEPGLDPEGNPVAGSGPGSITATPGAPAIPGSTIEGHTLSSLVKTMGADTVARLMSSEQGRRALQDKGVLTEEEMSKRSRITKAREEYKTMMDSARDAMINGDASGSLMSQARAWERIAESADDPNKAAWAHQLAANLQKQALEARDNEEANTDYSLFGASWAKYQKQPNHENLDALMEAASNMKSKEGRGLRDRLFQNMSADALKGLNNPNLAALYDEVSTVMGQASKAGEKMTLGQAFNKVLQTKPELVGPLINSYLNGKTTLPDEVQEALFGEMKFKKEEFRVAQMLTERIDGLNLNDEDPEKRKLAGEAFARHLKDMVAIRSTTTNDRILDHYKRQEIERGMRSDLAEAQKLRLELDKDPMYRVYKMNPQNARPAVREGVEGKLAEIKRLTDRAEDARRTLGLPGSGRSESPAPTQQPDPAKLKGVFDEVKKLKLKDPAKRYDEIVKRLKALGIDPNTPVINQPAQ